MYNGVYVCVSIKKDQKFINIYLFKNLMNFCNKVVIILIFGDKIFRKDKYKYKFVQ